MPHFWPTGRADDGAGRARPGLAGPTDYAGGMAEDQQSGHSGLSLFDGVLIVGGGIIAIIVAFAVFSFIAGVVWFVIKVAIVVALIALVAKLVFGRHS